MSDYPMLISNKLHSFRNFVTAKIQIDKNSNPFMKANRSRCFFINYIVVIFGCARKYTLKNSI